MTDATDNFATGLERQAAAMTRASKDITDANLAAKALIDRAGHPDAPHLAHAGGPVERRPPAFELVQMRRWYVGEDWKMRGWVGLKQVRYLTSAERAQHVLTVRDGRLYNVHGELYDTRSDLWMWVMDKNGTLYAAQRSYRDEGRFHHGSLLAGEAVTGAGTMRVENGQILWFTDNGGHYRPNRRHTMQVVEHMRSLGLQIDNEQIIFAAVD